MIEAVTGTDALIAGAALAQAVFLFGAIVATYLTLRDTRAAREMARIREVVSAIAGYETLRGTAMTGDLAAWARAGSQKVRLQAAMAAAGKRLPATDAYLKAANPFPQLELLDPALNELGSLHGR